MITSRQNSFIKFVRSLSDKKQRDENSLFVVEGLKVVKEAISCGLQIYALVVTESALDKLEAENSDVRFETVSDDIYAFISADKSPQGAMAIIKKPLKTAAHSDYRILLDGVSDPANVGAIIRTAAAAGYTDVYVTEDCADPFGQKSVRASMSGIFKVNVINCIREEFLKEIDIPLIVADMKGEDIFSFKKLKAFCLAVGSEGNGVSKAVKKRAERVISLPMQNNMESLNVAVCAGIMMYNLK